MHIETKLVQAGNRQDPLTGAVAMPIHHSTTFSHPAPGRSTGYDYTRTSNPTRDVLERTIASLENGSRGFAFASGMAAVSCVFGLLSPGDHLVISDDLYGGTYRLLEQVLCKAGISVTYADTGDIESVRTALQSNTKAIFIETPTNPTMKISDLQACTALARARGILTIVDNTFMTPVFQRPLEQGADIVLHSATKYLGGHNDVLAGLVVVSDPDLGDKIQFLQNSIGAVLGPQDCWLLIRGMKTLALRMERHEQNARITAAWLSAHPLVKRVYYPGMDAHPRRHVHARQSGGNGGMISFEVVDQRLVAPLLGGVQMITFAESLGGVESLITYPATQTHHDIPQQVREAVGVTDALLRLSVGIEHIEDILSDLTHAFAIAEREVSIQ